MGFNTAHFARMPEAKKAHTLMKRPFIHAGTMLHGDIVPLYCKLCSPGEVIDERLFGNIRMFPTGPLFSSIKASFNAFFIPLRLVWEKTAEFFGENKTSSGPQPSQYQVPHRTINNIAPGNTADKVRVYSVSHYLGKPLFKGNSIDSFTGYNGAKVSILKERAYWLTVSEWYRHEQIMNPVILDKSNLGNIGTLDGQNLTISSYCQKCCKDFDYFTTMTRSPQYGPDVTLPLGASAPVITGSTDIDLTPLGSSMHLGYVGTNSFPQVAANLAVTPGGEVHGDNSGTGTFSSSGLAPTNLIADLSQATSATIDELYLSMAAQAWYHNANYGSRYFEMLQVHYGVYNPDLVLQRPDHIGEAKRDILVQPVVATATTTNGGEVTKLGTPGASSSTNIEIKFPRYACGEWGFYMVLVNTYHDRYYPAGVAREDLYMDMFDFFFPEFSNIGDMGVKEIEAFYTSASDDEKLIGFQEAWAEMRYSPNRLSGLLDPYADSNNSSFGNALKEWVLAEKWANAPTFSKQFILENRDAFINASINGQNGPDYVFSFYFDEKTLSEVPLFSVPGLPGRGRGL